MNKIIKSIAKIFTITSVFVFISICMLSGCSISMPTADDIKNDLNNTEFIDVSELYRLNDGEKKTMPIIEVSITNSEKKDEICNFTCTVIQENENYKKESQVIISYYKQEDWIFNTFNEISTSISPIAGVPVEILKRYSVFGTELSNIVHNFDDSALTDRVSWNYIIDYENCTKTISKEANFTFRDVGLYKYPIWDCNATDYTNIEVINREWKYDKLIGSVWQGDLGFGGIRTLKINNIDTTSHTIDISYGYSDLKNHEICSYSVKDYTQGEPYQALIIPLTYDVYKVEICEDYIWFGANLYKIEEGNGKSTNIANTQRQLHIGWSEFEPLSYYNNQEELVGFDIELAKYVCEYCGWKTDFVEIPFDASFASLKNGNIDCYWSGMAKTDERMKFSDFTDVYLSTYIDGDEIEDFSVACKKGDSELVNNINKALQTAQKNGTIQKLKDKYGLK